jgi:membrane-associated protease RseP (regulator of RpoE activity)
MVFLTALGQWVVASKWVLLFYLIVIILIIIYRKRFEVEGGFILLYKTKWGMKFIDKISGKYGEFIKIIGYSAIGIGFVGMILISVMLLKGMYNLIFVPNAPATLGLVIPGVKIPGNPVFVPFVYGIIALFIVVVVHEFGHGIVARANGLKIKSTGIGFMGPIPLAFVEPDEKEVVKKSSIIQQSIFAAGPFFNILLCIVMLGLIAGTNAITTGMTVPYGFQFTQIQNNSAAERYGLQENITYNTVNGMKVDTQEDLVSALSDTRPNDTVIIGNDEKNTTIVLSQNPSAPSRGYLGVSGITTQYELKSKSETSKKTFNALLLLSNPFASDLTGYTLFQWIYVLSLGIGLANLLPLGPVDGGRMLNKAATDIKGKKKGVKIWIIVSFITLFVMILLVFVPIIKTVLFKA